MSSILTGTVVDRGDDDLADLVDAALLLLRGGTGRRLAAGLSCPAPARTGSSPPPKRPTLRTLRTMCALDHQVAADVGVAVGQGGLQLGQGDAVALQPVGIGVDLVALDRAAAAGDVHDARHAAELALQHPVLQGLEVVEGVDVVAERSLGLFSV